MSSDTKTSEKPILFSDAMVRAILDGRKTQTRRVVKPPSRKMVYRINSPYTYADNSFRVESGLPDSGHPWYLHVPFSHPDDVDCWPHEKDWGLERVGPPYAPGDVLWVKEALVKKSSCYGDKAAYAADGLFVTTGPHAIDTGVRGDGARHVEASSWPWKRNKLSARYCPRWASRLSLLIEDIRVERVQDISAEDAMAEGVFKVRNACYVVRGTAMDRAGLGHSEPETAFGGLWDEVNGARDGCSWESNPWVFAITFSPITNRKA